MTEQSRFQEVLFAAREASVSRAPQPDNRDSVQVYLDLAWLIRYAELMPTLELQIPVSQERRENMIAAEAYALAQPAHLHDGGFKTEELEGMLHRFGKLQK